MFRVKMDKNLPSMEKVDSEKLNSKSNAVSIKLSKNVIEAMRIKAGIVNKTSANAILYAYITKTLSE